MHNILVIGAVSSTAKVIEQLINHRFNIVGVLGHEPLNKDLVSGWADLKFLSIKHDINYLGFQKINEKQNVEWAKTKNPDIIFAVGFSQLISDEWLNMPRLGCIGFHPTFLPRGRGRAPLAWITLEKQKGASTFFLMGKGADDGPVFVQSEFDVEDRDDAKSVEGKILSHIEKALDKWLPELKNGIWNPIPQNDQLASWYGVRKLEDGWINWNDSAYFIDRLIKATTIPHPGAYTYFKDRKVIIWHSELEEQIPIRGVIGRVLLKDTTKGYLIQTGDGLLWINSPEYLNGELLKINVGDKLGYNIEDEIYNLKKRIYEQGNCDSASS